MRRTRTAKKSTSRVASIAAGSASNERPAPMANKENQSERAYRKLKRLILDNKLSSQRAIAGARCCRPTENEPYPDSGSHDQAAARRDG